MAKARKKKEPGKRGPKTYRDPRAVVPIRCRVTPEMRQIIREAAAERGLPISQFAENAVIEAAKNITGK